ncbi:NAD(P)/FAD-dependent oxidoreductase (plasmid) [Paraburkholderia sprentiae WSM5005]|uniref:NAD(P)/FAD-dependent oxidoreductase n=1 Tax=Paraburkholderia sprentiae WSM5005 TaxID=754502 RepID=A0A1I9YUC2_9BURK|nr:NAD(P)/FAD-dependent oxidoreductase [Paraburkholderia sprentiae]APA89783.1 NAD(P)/FAD-dependent oxidoreductase [Paraburkholderia sprentiae WSM5005]
MHRFVIVGGGAGGIELATRLGDRYGGRRRSGAQRASITLIDRNPTHIWKPLLHEVAAGSLDPFAQELAYAAQAQWHGFQFVQGELVGLNRGSRHVLLSPLLDDDGTELVPPRRIEYDSLILAIGSTTHYFGVPGAAENSLALDTVAHAERFRKRLIAACIRAEQRESAEGSACATLADRTPRVQVAIVGGGATGVELSAELRNTAKVLSSYGLHRLDPTHDVGIMLIEAGPRILPALKERVSTAAAGLLGKLNVKLMVDERVAEITPGLIRTKNGKTIRADLTVWAAGIKAPAVLSTLDGLTVNHLGQLNVRRTLQTSVDDHVFAFGDCAACPWLGYERNVPPRAQAAHQQASFLVKALARRIDGQKLPEFAYRDLGSLVSLGHANAVGSLMGGLIGGSMLVDGLLARFMYLSLYRMHVAALHGYARMIVNTLAHRLRRSTAPHVKLH